VMRGPEEGFLAFENGCLREANLGGTRGVKALARMLTWTDGHFEFHSRIDPSVSSRDSQPLEGALLEAMRLIDEGAGVDKTEFPPHASLSVDAKERQAQSGLGKLEEAILDLAATGMNVQRILDIVPETDEEIYLAMSRLVDLDVLAIHPA